MKRTLLLLSLLLAFNLSGFAQTMAWHLYLIPVVGTGTIDDPRRPKYLTNNYACMDYGFQPVMLCAANLDNASDISLSNAADVQKIPDNLDSNVGAAALATVQNALENRKLPSGWITTATTYRTVLRTVGGFFAFLQRYAVVANDTSLLMGGSVNLDTQFNQLPQAIRSNLQATATDLGLNTTGMSGTTTLRVILKNIADQWGQRVIVLGGITI